MANQESGARTIKHYEVKETLGCGALGTVYRAWDTKLNRTVALKVLTTELDDQRILECFHREARAIAALDHKNIVRVLDYSDADAKTQYIALEHLEGKSVADLMDDHGPLVEQIALCVAHEVVAALDYAHQQSIVHRDIKPENVIIEGGRVVLIDFGAMKLVDSHEWIPDIQVDQAHAVVGTAGFMAPEQIGGAAVDHRADIFAVGALLYNITTDQLPYAADSKDLAKLRSEARRGRYRDPRDFQPLLTAGFADLLSDCLAANPGDRIQVANALRERIAALLAAHGISDIAAVLQDYSQKPGLDQELDLRTVDTLTRELKHALLRDFKRAVRAQQPDRIIDATNRLRFVYRLFDDAEKCFLLDGQDKPRLLRGRVIRRGRWLMLGLVLGLVLGALAGLGLAVAVPRVLTLLRFGIAAVIGLG